MHALYKYRKKSPPTHPNSAPRVIKAPTQLPAQGIFVLLSHPLLFSVPHRSSQLWLTTPELTTLSPWGCTRDNAKQDNSEYFLPNPQSWCQPWVGSGGPCSLFSLLNAAFGRPHNTCFEWPATRVFWENGLKNDFIICPTGKCVQAEQGKAILQSSTVLTTALLIAAWRNRKTRSSTATKKWAWLNCSDSQFWLTCLIVLFKKSHFWNNFCVFFLNCLPLHSFKVIAKAQSQCRSKQITMTYKCILKL